jgi:hypothetical protein
MFVNTTRNVMKRLKRNNMWCVCCGFDKKLVEMMAKHFDAVEDPICCEMDSSYDPIGRLFNAGEEYQEMRA